MRLRGSPDRAWVDEFLNTQTIPVRIATRTPAGGLWMLSLWYGYDADDAQLHLATARSSRVVEYLESDPDIAFEVSTNEVPYRGVRGQGVASLEPDEGKTHLRTLIDRYLGDTENDLANWLLREDREEVHVTVDVQKSYAWDYSDRMGEAESDE